MRILLGKTPRNTSSLSIDGAAAAWAAKKRNELPPELRGRATIVRGVNRIFRRAARFLVKFVELGGGLS
jgi:hypothetical protein